MFIYKRCDCHNPQRKLNIPKASLNRLASLLKLVSVPSRLNILLLLDNSTHCVCDIMTHTSMSQTLASHHLADLTGAGLVASKKNGQFVDYYLTNKGKRVVEILNQSINLK